MRRTDFWTDWHLDAHREQHRCTDTRYTFTPERIDFRLTHPKPRSNVCLLDWHIVLHAHAHIYIYFFLLDTIQL